MYSSEVQQQLRFFIFHVRKASMYLIYLDLSLRSSLAQKNLVFFFHLFVSLSLWIKNRAVYYFLRFLRCFIMSNLGQKSLKGRSFFKKLGWTVLHLPIICEVVKKSHAY